jgi:Transposase DDE domain group 1
MLTWPSAGSSLLHAFRSSVPSVSPANRPSVWQPLAETADNLRFHHAESSQPKLRTYASFTYQAGSWTRPRKVVARLECSLQPDAGESTSTGMRQEVDIRYVVTSLEGSAKYLYEDVYCQRGQMENLIKLHKAQLASDRMSCHSATANGIFVACNFNGLVPCL